MLKDITPADREAVLSMMAEFYSSPAVEHRVDPEHFIKTFDTALSKGPHLRAHMIEREGERCGYLLVSFMYSNEAGGMTVIIDELYIAPAHRGKGLGRKVMEAIEAEYPDAKRFRLEVVRGNLPALALYESLGYGELLYMQMVKDI